MMATDPTPDHLRIWEFQASGGSSYELHACKPDFYHLALESNGFKILAIHKIQFALSALSEFELTFLLRAAKCEPTTGSRTDRHAETYDTGKLHAKDLLGTTPLATDEQAQQEIAEKLQTIILPITDIVQVYTDPTEEQIKQIKEEMDQVVHAAAA